MRILLLTQWFQPEPNFKGIQFAKALTDCGHEVEVLTGFPNYPGGRLYPGYKVRPWQKEVIDGIRVIRVALYPSHDRSGLRRLLNYSSFGLSSAILGPFLIHKPDVIYVYNLVTLGFASTLLKILNRCKCLYDIQDLWPDSVTASGMLPKSASSMLDKFSNAVYRKADHIAVLSPGMKATLVDRGLAPDDIDVIYNWCDEGAIQFTSEEVQAVKEELGFNGHFNVVFAGTMGKMQALDTVIDAASLLKRKLPHVKFTLIGGGIEADHLKMKVSELGLQNVQILPRRPVSEIGAVLQATDVLLVHLKDDPLFRITIPSKIQAYLYAGKPIIVGVEGDASQLVVNANAGIPCKPEDSRSVADVVERFACMDQKTLDDMGAMGRSFYDKELSFAAGVSKFDKLFRSLMCNN
ncbi:MAG: glycosyltransferase family 4 protein [Armatimonadota bacterium]